MKGVELGVSRLRRSTDAFVHGVAKAVKATLFTALHDLAANRRSARSALDCARCQSPLFAIAPRPGSRPGEGGRLNRDGDGRGEAVGSSRKEAAAMGSAVGLAVRPYPLGILRKAPRVGAIAACLVHGFRGRVEYRVSGGVCPRPSTPDPLTIYLSPAPLEMASMTRSRLKLPGFWRGGNSLKLCSHSPT